jgi:hypothetical protein
MTPSLATFAEYFRLGLETGVLLPEDAKAWAMSVIGELDEPPGEVIEVSWSKGVAMTLESLGAVRGERDKALAAGWLLALLRGARQTSDDDLQRVIGRQCTSQEALHSETMCTIDLMRSMMLCRSQEATHTEASTSVAGAWSMR